MAKWLSAHPDTAPWTISINVSTRQLREFSFTHDVAAALTDNSREPCRLIIEMTDVGGATADTLAALRTLGVRIALNDFGTGQSALALLVTCAVDQIKLDRSFIPHDNVSAIAAAVLQLAHGFGVETVAEGVKTDTEAQYVLALGFDRAQGYHLARPMAADVVDTLLYLDKDTVHQGAL